MPFSAYGLSFLSVLYGRVMMNNDGSGEAGDVKKGKNMWWRFLFYFRFEYYVQEMGQLRCHAFTSLIAYY